MNMNGTNGTVNVSFKCTALQTYLTVIKDYEHYDGIILPVLIILNVICCIAIVASNVTVVITIIKTTLLHTPGNFLILGLAISDLGVGLIGQPSFIMLLFYELQNDFLRYCEADYISIGAFWILAFASLLTLTALSLDRFFAVHFHLRYRNLVTPRRVGVVLVLIWIYSITAWLIYSFIEPDFIIVQDAVGFLAIIVNMFVIIKVYRCVR